MKIKILLVGFGTQGQKRYKIEKKNIVAIVDTFHIRANYKNIQDVPNKIYNTVFICTNDEEKNNIIKYSIINRKNILVEKPLRFSKKSEFNYLLQTIKKNNLCLYTAYNHRFEPNLIKLKYFLKTNEIGKIYLIKLLYGNGTVGNMKKSSWRSKNTGVITDLGSHTLDIYLFLFNELPKNIRKIVGKKNEIVSCDYFQFDGISEQYKIPVNFELSYIHWENTFKIEIISSKYRIEMNGLRKWKGSKLNIQKRKLPSGAPKEKVIYDNGRDISWEKEHNFMKKNLNKFYTNLENDFKIERIFKKLLG